MEVTLYDKLCLFYVLTSPDTLYYVNCFVILYNLQLMITSYIHAIRKRTASSTATCICESVVMAREMYTFFELALFCVCILEEPKNCCKPYSHIGTFTSGSIEIVRRSQNIVCNTFVILMYMRMGVGLSCLERLSRESETDKSVSKK